MEQQIQDMAKNSKADVTALDDLHEFCWGFLLLYPPAKRRGHIDFGADLEVGIGIDIAVTLFVCTISCEQVVGFFMNFHGYIIGK